MEYFFKSNNNNFLELVDQTELAKIKEKFTDDYETWAIAKIIANKINNYSCNVNPISEFDLTDDGWELVQNQGRYKNIIKLNKLDNNIFNLFIYSEYSLFDLKLILKKIMKKDDMNKTKSMLSYSVETFFKDEEFYEVHPPIIPPEKDTINEIEEGIEKVEDIMKKEELKIEEGIEKVEDIMKKEELKIEEGIEKVEDIMKKEELKIEEGSIIRKEDEQILTKNEVGLKENN